MNSSSTYSAKYKKVEEFSIGDIAGAKPSKPPSFNSYSYDHEKRGLAKLPLKPNSYSCSWT
jgi:hypothetical protein